MERKRKNVAAAKIIVLGLVMVLSACQTSQAPLLPKVPEIQFDNIDIKSVDVSDELSAMENLAETESELRFSALDKQFDKTNRTIVNEDPNQLPAELVNRQVCKNDVEVSYKVPNQDGYESSYIALVQLQARLKAVSEDRQNIKVQMQGWYTNNKNLRQWLPSMKALPFYPEFSLKQGTLAWANAAGWQLCRFQDNQNSTI